jgi:lantibiotic modifying enzyme
VFVDEALRIGRELDASAIRYESRCTWIGNGISDQSGMWLRTAGALGPDFMVGTAGVGWFLALLGSAASEAALARTAAEAFRQSLAGVNDLIAGGRFGFFDGALGVAWSLIAGGRVLHSEEFEQSGSEAAHRAAAEIVRRSKSAGDPALLEGDAGVLFGLLALAELTEDTGLLEPCEAIAGRLVLTFPERVVRPAEAQRDGVGLARGASGTGMALARWAALVGDDGMLQAALRAWNSERPWHDTTTGWFGASAHTWSDDETLARSLCSGAAGIGLARLAGYRLTGAASLLAEAAATIDVVRRISERPFEPDASLCHGAAGEIDLLLTAASVTGEKAHVDAAHRLGTVMVETARRRRHYASGLGSFGPTPGLLLGSAGAGLAMLRLEDPELVPCGVFPLLPLVQTGATHGDGDSAAVS